MLSMTSGFRVSLSLSISFSNDSIEPINAFAGFELGFDHWRTICPLG